MAKNKKSSFFLAARKIMVKKENILDFLSFVYIYSEEKDHRTGLFTGPLYFFREMY